MNLYRHKFLLYPLIFIGVLFAADKIFLLPVVRDNFIQPGGMLYYRHREEQITRLRAALAEDRGNRKIGVVFGDSRSFAVGTEIARYAGVSGATLYNFAGPQALPAYHAYLSERIFKGARRPDFLLLGVSPGAFNRNTGIFASPVLNFGVSAEFAGRYSSQIPARDLQSYVNSRRFALAGLGFSTKNLALRLKNSLSKRKTDQELSPMALAFLRSSPGGNQERALWLEILRGASRPDLTHYSLKKSPQALILRRGLGAQYAWFGAKSPQELLEETERLADIYFRNFVVSPEQMFFLRRTLARARLAGVKTLVFRPRVNPYLLAAFRKQPAVGRLWERIQEIARQEGADAVDLNREAGVRCDQYYDASHMSITCFPGVTRYLLERVLRKN